MYPIHEGDSVSAFIDKYRIIELRYESDSFGSNPRSDFNTIATMKIQVQQLKALIELSRIDSELKYEGEVRDSVPAVNIAYDNYQLMLKIASNPRGTNK